ncbi:superoxide dismutase [Candidatus Gracilibacteria bacterium]|nr:superoxide dismutase [Candidatus Gracilibacteria bacterium]
MKHELMELPFAKNALEPYMSEETLEYHYSKHHQAYVTKLNELIQGTEFADMELEDIIKKSKGGIFNNAAQIWNHNLFWNTLKVNNGIEPMGRLADMLTENFGSFDGFKETFTKEALARFGSGWVWLVQKDQKLEIYSTPNGENPLTEGGEAILGCDVWEHAYYIDYRNDRKKFIDNFFNIVNWKMLESKVK